MEWNQWFAGGRPAEPGAAAWLPRLTSRSGYERQEAVAMLGRLRAHEALPGLLTRVNDWVPEVRSAARSAVGAFLDDDALPAWREALPALVDVLRGGRDDHAPLLAAIAAFLLAPARVERLKESGPDLPPLVRRWLDANLWHAAGDAQRTALLAERLRGGDVVAARWALDRVDELASATTRSALWLLGCDSPSGTVRAHALRRLCDTAPDIGLANASRLALDPRTAVRDVALARLRAAGRTEPVRLLAEAQLVSPVGTPHHGVPALLVLAVLDPAGTTARCERLMTLAGGARPHATLRGLALQHLLGASAGETQQRWLRRALSDASARVQRVAVDAVAHGVPPPSPTELWPLVLEHREVQAFRRGLRLLQYWDLWKQLGELLELARLPLPDGGAAALAVALDLWEVTTRRGVTAPAEPLASQLRGQWRSSAPALPPALRQRLAFALTVSGLLRQD
ncbi:HEAT repeat domain-containing protein [Mitsuaria sp. GD03876]|uniref:HEAT repeat domain-containing protein n=1 Tax=Mitsuaria sp. GD03876 TaxID=2975399 RepID=UPI0024489B1F|nr:HEAT repeat domain-containing protein [Mitsuaria sp. GD03876]MDH0864475.1 hypothetical protein [Mitsuaria sp. GD03876]